MLSRLEADPLLVQVLSTGDYCYSLPWCVDLAHVIVRDRSSVVHVLNVAFVSSLSKLYM